MNTVAVGAALGRPRPGQSYPQIRLRGGLPPHGPKGKTIEVSASSDGMTWEAVNPKPIEVDWPDHLKVALVAINSSLEPFSATFEEFSFKGK